VVTVCDDNTEQCPVWLGKGTQVHLGFPDPAAATGSEQDKLTMFRSVRDDMLVRVIALLENNAH
jgi:arsenate reductase (thioredoxin)